MPNRAQRREEDGRAPRFESEIRQSEMIASGFPDKRKFMCSNCHRMFEEKSRTCPRCEKGRTMGELKPLPGISPDEQRRSVERARAHRGARMEGGI